jgi:SAM-dependent methyltransferase
MGETWGKDSYQEVAEYYDYVTTHGQRNDVGFFVEMAQGAGGAVLEIGCGTGRVLIPTARTGVDITGFDLSTAMLTVCRQQLAQEPEAVQARVQLVQGDMRHFDLGRTFALVMLPFRPFQHLLTVADQLACLDCIQRHLQPGGRLVLDLFNPSLHILANDAKIGVESVREPEFILPDGRRVLWLDKVVARDLFKQVQDVEIIYDVTYPDGRRERRVQAFTMRYLFRYEVEHLLARAGFVVEHLYADYNRTPYGTTYPGELIFVAKA